MANGKFTNNYNSTLEVHKSNKDAIKKGPTRRLDPFNTYENNVILFSL